MLKRRYSYLFPFIDKHIGLSVFIDLTASKGQNLNFHLGQLNYKSHPLPTMLCPLPTFPGSFPMIPAVNSSPQFFSPQFFILDYLHFLAQATSATLSSPLPSPLLLLFRHRPLSSLSLPCMRVFVSVFYFAWNVYCSYSEHSQSPSHV